MRSLAGCLALLLVSIPVPTGAQVAVDPGGVATVVARVAAPDRATGDSVTLTVRMVEGFDLFAPSVSTRAADRDTLRIPLTFGVAATAGAGEVEAGRVVADWGNGVTTTTPFSVRVRTRYQLGFHLGRELVTGEPGAPVEVAYYVRNRGNTVDSVGIEVRAPTGWQVGVLPKEMAIAPGDTAAGTIQLLPPRSVPPGSEAVILAEARGYGARETAPVRHVAVTESPWFGDLASVPSTVFVGSTTGAGAGSVALHAEGAVRPETRVSLRLRHTDEAFITPALRDGLSGPDFRLDVTHRAWRLGVGDLFTRSDLFTGPSIRADGADVQWADADRGVGVTVGVPSSELGQEEGHLLRGSGYVETGDGSRWTAMVADLRQDARLLEGFGIRSAGVRYERGRREDGLLSVQAGLMRVASDSSGAVTGPAVEAQYQRADDRYTVTARARRVPATVPRTAALGDELLLSGTAGLAGGLSGVGWGYLTRSPLLGIEHPGHSSAVAAGLRYSLESAATQLQLTGHLRSSDRPYLGQASERRTLRTTIDALVGRVTIQLNGEWGRSETTDTVTRTDPYEYARAAVTWSAGPDWGWAGLSYRNTGPDGRLVFLDTGGRVTVAGVRLEGGLNASLDRRIEDGVSFWTGARFEVTRTTMATLGVDYTPIIDRDHWRVSLGVSRRFALPLPLPRQPAVEGVVFEDLDGDRVRDPGEPGLPDVAVRLGVLDTRTDGKGAFRFDDAVDGPLRVDTRSLPLGLMVPADAHLPTTGSVAIPVVRTAAVQLDLFMDRNGNGSRDAVDEPAAGVVVSLVAPDGRTRDAAADDQGRVRLSAVSPGRYTLVVHPPSTRHTGGSPVERTIDVEPGATVALTIPVPVRRREIRIQGAAPSDRR